jgi:hypothetical protein
MPRVRAWTNRDNQQLNPVYVRGIDLTLLGSPNAIPLGYRFSLPCEG